MVLLRKWNDVLFREERSTGFRGLQMNVEFLSLSRSHCVTFALLFSFSFYLSRSRGALETWQDVTERDKMFFVRKVVWKILTVRSVITSRLFYYFCKCFRLYNLRGCKIISIQGITFKSSPLISFINQGESSEFRTTREPRTYKSSTWSQFQQLILIMSSSKNLPNIREKKWKSEKRKSRKSWSCKPIGVPPLSLIFNRICHSLSFTIVLTKDAIKARKSPAWRSRIGHTRTSLVNWRSKFITIIQLLCKGRDNTQSLCFWTS